MDLDGYKIFIGDVLHSAALKLSTEDYEALCEYAKLFIKGQA